MWFGSLEPCTCLSHLACYRASSTSHHFCKCKDNGNCKYLLRLLIHERGENFVWNPRQKGYLSKYINIQVLLLRVKSVGKEVLSFSIVCRLCGVTPTGNASLKRMKRVWIVLLFFSMLHKYLICHSPQVSTFLPSLLKFHWLPKYSLNLFVREGARSGLVGSKWLKAVIPTRFTLHENGSQPTKSKAKLGFSPWDKWSSGRADQCIQAQSCTITPPCLFNLNTKFKCKHLKDNLSPENVLMPKWTILFTHSSHT